MKIEALREVLNASQRCAWEILFKDGAKQREPRDLRRIPKPWRDFATHWGRGCRATWLLDRCFGRLSGITLLPGDREFVWDEAVQSLRALQRILDFVRSRKRKCELVDPFESMEYERWSDETAGRIFADE